MKKNKKSKKKIKIQEDEISISDSNENNNQNFNLIADFAIESVLKKKINRKNAFLLPFPNAEKIKEFNGLLKRN